jgi:hypothetical protein
MHRQLPIQMSAAAQSAVESAVESAAASAPASTPAPQGAHHVPPAPCTDVHNSNNLNKAWMVTHVRTLGGNPLNATFRSTDARHSSVRMLHRYHENESRLV